MAKKHVTGSWIRALCVIPPRGCHARSPGAVSASLIDLADRGRLVYKTS